LHESPPNKRVNCPCIPVEVDISSTPTIDIGMECRFIHVPAIKIEQTTAATATRAPTAVDHWHHLAVNACICPTRSLADLCTRRFFIQKINNIYLLLMYSGFPIESYSLYSVVPPRTPDYVYH
jgi:hypothetical protein